MWKCAFKKDIAIIATHALSGHDNYLLIPDIAL